MAWLFGQLVRERALFKHVILAALISTIFAVAPAFTVRIVLDRVLLDNIYSTLNVLAGGVLLLIIFEAILSYLRRILTQVVTSRIDGRVSLYIVEKVLKLPMEYFECTSTGRIITNLQQVYQIRNFLTGQLFGAFLDIVPLVVLVPLLLFVEWHLALTAFALAGIIFMIIWLFMDPMRRLFGKVVAVSYTHLHSHNRALPKIHSGERFPAAVFRRYRAEATGIFDQGLRFSWPRQCTGAIQTPVRDSTPRRAEYYCPRSLRLAQATPGSGV